MSCHLLYYIRSIKLILKYYQVSMTFQFYTQEERNFNRLTLDFIKKKDLKVVFEILMVEPENRTIADINTLIKIMLNVAFF
jgi:hypothetical protein